VDKHLETQTTTKIGSTFNILDSEFGSVATHGKIMICQRQGNQNFGSWNLEKERKPIYMDLSLLGVLKTESTARLIINYMLCGPEATSLSFYHLFE
jgi:hypothetical protein